jgi:hypothetical protein
MLLGTICCSAQTAKDLFRAMPDSILPLLSANNRADCTDFMESKMKAEVVNKFKEKSLMTDMTADYIALNLSESSTWQMKVLPMTDGSKIVCVINTTMGPTADSDIDFYTDKWMLLDRKDFIKLPAIDDFFKAPTTTDENDSTYIKYRQIRPQADMLLMKAILGKTDNTLTFTFTTPDYLSKEAAKDIKPFVRETIKYTWDNHSFVRE